MLSWNLETKEDNTSEVTWELECHSWPTRCAKTYTEACCENAAFRFKNISFYLPVYLCKMFQSFR